MKNNVITIILVVLMNGLNACSIEGNGKLASSMRTVPAFTGIELSCIGHVYVTQGDKQEVKVEAEENLIGYLETVVKNGVLVIRCEENIHPKEQVNVYITVKELCMLELSGSGDMETKNEITCEHMAIRLSGSGNIHAHIDSKSVKAELSGSGELTLNGRSAESDLHINGSGDINADKLQTFTASVNIVGSGNGRVAVDNQLVVTITGSGNVYYVKEPGKIDSRITGSGNIFKI